MELEQNKDLEEEKNEKKAEDEIIAIKSTPKVEPKPFASFNSLDYINRDFNKGFSNSLDEILMKKGMYDELVESFSNPMILNPAMEGANEFVSLLTNSEGSELKGLLTS